MAQRKAHNSNLDLKYHPLKGKQIRNKNTGKVYSIERVIGQFYRGWYITLLLEQDGSHDQVIWKNITSKEDWIPEEIQENQEIYEIILDSKSHL